MFEIKISQLKEFPAPDWHAVIQLRSEVFVVEQRCYYSDPDRIDPEAWHALGIQDGEVIACARVYRDHHWHIGRVAVHAAHRGGGFGKAIIHHCLEFINQSDAGVHVELSAQVYLVRYYQHLGFSPVGRMYLEDGIPHLNMRYERMRAS